MRVVLLLTTISTIILASMPMSELVSNTAKKSLKRVDAKIEYSNAIEKKRVTDKILKIGLYGVCTEHYNAVICKDMDEKEIAKDIEELTTKQWESLPFASKKALYEFLQSYNKVTNETEDQSFKKPKLKHKTKQEEEVKEVVEPSHWQSTQKIEPIDDSAITYIFNEKLRDSFDTKYKRLALLTIRARKGELELYISKLGIVKEQRVITIRYGKEKAEKIKCSLATSKDAIFIEDSKEALNNLRKADKLAIQYIDYLDVTHTIVFDTKRLDDALSSYDKVFQEFLTH
jgi:hypothetical protein